MHAELLYRVALTLVPGIGSVQARLLTYHFGNASAVFSAKKSLLEKIEGIGTVRATALKAFAEWSRCETEIRFAEKHHITPLFLTDAGYPGRLLHCYDPPTLLYYKGEADLNAAKIIGIVGTRSKTEYGKAVTDQLLEDLAGHQVLVVSGLALGIDAIAHRGALKQQLPTIAVVGHGLDNIYPPEHAHLAKTIVAENGGLLTEFKSGTRPDKHNFPARNRIVAGLSDVLVVVETAVKGGSMITAELAAGYNRDVFAFPGRASDPQSAGCNHLIRSNQASLITCAADLLAATGWSDVKVTPRKKQQQLFITLTESEQVIVDLLNNQPSLDIDAIRQSCRLSVGAIATAILSLEMQLVIKALPGKQYALL